MGKLSQRVVTESIEHYRELIDDYNKMIAENKRKWMNPNISDKKRHAYKMLIEIMEAEKRNCQKAVERLLNE